MSKGICFVCNNYSEKLQQAESQILEGVFYIKCPVCVFTERESRDIVLRIAKYYLVNDNGKIPDWFRAIIKKKKYFGDKITPEEVQYYES